MVGVHATRKPADAVGVQDQVAGAAGGAQHHDALVRTAEADRGPDRGLHHDLGNVSKKAKNG